MSGAASRNRGARAEVQVVNYLRQWWPDARRYLAGDGRQPGDIDVWPGVCIEVKDRAASAWPTWRQQVLDEAGPDRVAVLVRRTRGQRDVGAWVCEVESAGWRELVSGQDVHRVEVVSCPRTSLAWVRTTFGAVCDLIRADGLKAGGA